MDYLNFWHHNLAVGVASEMIAGIHPDTSGLSADEAFVCGLVHDLGKLALDQILPKSFDRVIELVEIHQGNIAEYEQRIIGLNHQTLGKRLAEQWRLPRILQDCIGLHGSPYDMLPELEHKRMICLVSLADMVVRQQHIGYSGNFTFHQEPADLARQLGFEYRKIAQVIEQLHDRVEDRIRALNLDDTPSRKLYMASI